MNLCCVHTLNNHEKQRGLCSSQKVSFREKEMILFYFAWKYKVFQTILFPTMSIWLAWSTIYLLQMICTIHNNTREKYILIKNLGTYNKSMLCSYPELLRVYNNKNNDNIFTQFQVFLPWITALKHPWGRDVWHSDFRHVRVLYIVRLTML